MLISKSDTDLNFKNKKTLKYIYNHSCVVARLVLLLGGSGRFFFKWSGTFSWLRTILVF